MVNVEIKTKKLNYSAEEAYKSLRTNIQFCGEDKKVIAVTSCTPNEGKSSVTLNLAISMAQAGKKVIKSCRIPPRQAPNETKRRTIQAAFRYLVSL